MKQFGLFSSFNPFPLLQCPGGKEEASLLSQPPLFLHGWRKAAAAAAAAAAFVQGHTSKVSPPSILPPSIFPGKNRRERRRIFPRSLRRTQFARKKREIR